MLNEGVRKRKKENKANRLKTRETYEPMLRWWNEWESRHNSQSFHLSVIRTTLKWENFIKKGQEIRTPWSSWRQCDCEKKPCHQGRHIQLKIMKTSWYHINRKSFQREKSIDKEASRFNWRRTVWRQTCLFQNAHSKYTGMRNRVYQMAYLRVHSRAVAS